MEKKLFAAIAIAALFSSCAKELAEPSVNVAGVYAKIEQPFCADIETKSIASGADGLSFYWDKGENVAILGNDALGFFNSVSGGDSNAKLESTAFKLKDGVDYIAYIPAKSEGVTSTLSVSFTGQTQNRNNSTDHLKAYSYACGKGTKTDGADVINFSLRNQTSWFIIEYSLTEDTDIKAISLNSSDAVFTTQATLDIATTEWTSTKKSETATLDFTGEGISLKEGEVLRAFMSVFPDDLSGKTVTVNAIKKDGTNVVLKTFSGKQLQKNAFYTVKVGGATAVQVGDQVYSSLQQALDAVPDGGTVTLLSDITSEQGFTYKGGTVTKASGSNVEAVLDLGGHTLKVTADTKNSHRALKVTGGTLTIKNGTIDARNVDEKGEPADFNDKSKYTDRIYGTIRVENSNVNLDNITLYSNHLWGLSIKTIGKSNITLDNVTVNSRIGGGIEVAGGNAVIRNSTFTQQGVSNFASYISTGISVSNLGTAEIENTGFEVDGYHALYVYNSGGVINVNGGTFKSNGGDAVHVDGALFEYFHKEHEGTEAEDKALFDAFTEANGGYSSIVNIKSGDFTGKMFRTTSGEAAKYASLTISGGTFSVDPSAYIAEGYVAGEKNGRWEVSGAASIGQTHYSSLDEAIAAAVSGDVIELHTGITVPAASPKEFKLPAGVTLEGNGNTISGAVAIRVAAEGGTVKNVNFKDIHNEVALSDAQAEKYNVKGKIGTQSAVIASGLSGELTVSGCTFDNVDWDALQITPSSSPKINILGNTFRFSNTDASASQLRHIHIEGIARASIRINGNKFYEASNGRDIVNVGIFYSSEFNSSSNLTGNWFEYEGDRVNTHSVLYNNLQVSESVSRLFPALAAPDAQTATLKPVLYEGNTAILKTDVVCTVKYGGNADGNYASISEAIDKIKTVCIDEKKSPTLTLLIDYDGAIEIPSEATLTLKTDNTKNLGGTIVNNGVLTLNLGKDAKHTVSIRNNCKLIIKGVNTTVDLTGVSVDNSRELVLQNGVFDHAQIINRSGSSISVSQTNFISNPPAEWVGEWQVVDDTTYPGYYYVRSMKENEAVENGAIVKAGGTSMTNVYCKSFADAPEDRTKFTLLTDCNSDAVIKANAAKSIKTIDLNGHDFNGAISTDNTFTLNINNASSKKKDEAVNLTDIKAKGLVLGDYNLALTSTIQDAEVESLTIRASASCTITGGSFGSVIIQTYYATGTDTPQYSAELKITGGTFASGKVTHTFVNHPDGTTSEEVNLSEFVPDTHMVLQNGDKFVIVRK